MALNCLFTVYLTTGGFIRKLVKTYNNKMEKVFTAKCVI